MQYSTEVPGIPVWHHYLVCHSDSSVVVFLGRWLLITSCVCRWTFTLSSYMNLIRAKHLFSISTSTLPTNLWGPLPGPMVESTALTSSAHLASNSLSSRKSIHWNIIHKIGIICHKSNIRSHQYLSLNNSTCLLWMISFIPGSISVMSWYCAVSMGFLYSSARASWRCQISSESL